MFTLQKLNAVKEFVSIFLSLNYWDLKKNITYHLLVAIQS